MQPSVPPRYIVGVPSLGYDQSEPDGTYSVYIGDAPDLLDVKYDSARLRGVSLFMQDGQRSTVLMENNSPNESSTWSPDGHWDIHFVEGNTGTFLWEYAVPAGHIAQFELVLRHARLELLGWSAKPIRETRSPESLTP